MSNTSNFVIENGILTKYKGSGGDVVIPEDVETIANGAFEYCDSIETVIIPGSVQKIEEGAFTWCSNLTSVIIHEGMLRIADNAFSECTSLESVTIPNSVLYLGEHAFDTCTTVICSSKNLQSHNFSKYFSITCGVLKKYKGPGGDVTIPEGLTSIGDLAFSGLRLTKVTIPESITSIGDGAFYNCTSLKSVTIPKSVTSIGSSAFEGCYSLKEVNITDLAAWIRVHFNGNNSNPLHVRYGTSLYLNGAPITAAVVNSAMEVREELPVHAISFFEKAVKTPKLLASRMLFQSGKQWNEALTKAAQEVDKPAIICEMAHLVEEEGSEKQAAKLVDTVLDYLAELGLEEMKSAYAVLRKGSFKALRKLVLDESFQDKWFANAEIEELLPIEKLVKDNWKTTDSVKKLRTVVKQGVRYRDSDKNCSPSVVIFIVSEYASQLSDPGRLAISDYQSGYARGARFSELADQVAAALDTEQLREKLEELAYTDKTFKNGFVFAMARYGSGKQISHLCSEMRERANWGSHGVAGRQDVMIARGALMLSETREAMMALDKVGRLDVYAQMRGTDADTIRDTVLSDFGFDENGKKTYDLGGNQISVSMASDLTLRIYDENAKKNVKSIPKKNADVTLYEAAKADISDLKKNIKRVTKHRRDSIFADFLSGGGVDTAKWKKLYCGNPVLGAVARLIVWEQSGKTFTLSDTGMVDSNGTPVALDDTQLIRVAHPIEMQAEEIKDWQDYFVRNGLKQPFEQIWEPVYDLSTISAERYKGAVLPIYRFENKDQHGIHSYGLTAYSEDYGFNLDDCELDAEGSTWRIVPGITDDETYTLGAFKVTKRSRKSNHIIFMLDKWTVMDRIEKDDDSIVALLPTFTLAQLTEFIRLASEKGSTKCQAALMDYKNRNYEAEDPFAEFTLD